MKKLFFLILFSTTLLAQKRDKQSEYLPKGHLFEPLLLDPIEAQTYSCFARGFGDNEFNRGLLVPFSLGFSKNLVRWTAKNGHLRELALDVATFTQFEVYYNRRFQQVKRHIINSDYKISMCINEQIDTERSYRFRMYHVSSHLGDDYIINQGIKDYSPNFVNYEQADFTYSWQKKHLRYYAGAGLGIRPYFKGEEERKRIALQGGFLWKAPMEGKRNIQWLAGADVRLLQQTSFVPGIKAAVGVRIGEESKNPLNFLFEVYHGHMPYSQFEYQQGGWVAAGMYFNPF